MMKRILSFVMSIVMLLSALPLQAMAADISLVEAAAPVETVAVQETTVPATTVPEEPTESVCETEAAATEDTAAPVETEPAEAETEAPEEPAPVEAEQESASRDAAFDVVTDYAYTVLNGTYCEITGYTGTDTVLEIPGEIGGYIVQSIADKAFQNNKTLTSVTFPNTIETIGTYLFSGCTALTEVQLNEGLTAIGEYTFQNCTSLTAFAFPESVETIGEYLFAGCTALADVQLKEGLTAISQYAFRNCSALTEITLPEGVKTIGANAFENCAALAEVDLPESLVTIGNYAFKGCTSLETVTLPEGVQKLGYQAFADCTALSSINYPSGLTTMLSVYFNYSDHYGSVFSGCTSLTSLEIPEGVTAIPAHALRDCPQLEEIQLPESLETIGEYAFSGNTGLKTVEMKDKVTSVGSEAFRNCTGLESIAFSENLSTLGEYAFAGCTGLTEVTLPGSLVTIPNYAFRKCSGLQKLTLGEGIAEIGEYAFEACTGLTEIKFPESLATIRHYAFLGCTALETLTLPDGVSDLGYQAFANCTALKEAHYPTGLTTMLGCYFNYGNHYGSVFAGCKNLKTLEIPEGVMAIPAHALRECTYLEEVILPDSLENIGECAFYGCTGLKDLEMRSSLTAVGKEAFRNCTGLESITFSESLATLGEYAFAGCIGLTEISLPGSLERVPDYAFLNCNGLRKLTVGDGAAEIGREAFENCTGLTEVDLPQTLTTISHYAFKGCTALRELQLPDSVQNLGYQAFADCTRLASANYPASLTTMLGCYFNYGNHYGGIFAGCTDLLTLEIPEGVLSIPAHALRDCTALEEVVLPQSLTTICENAFRGNTALAKIWIDENVTTIGADAFTDCAALTIHGVEGSYAQTYAESNSIPFSAEPLVYPSSTISGSVLDQDGTGVAGVTVTLYDLTWDRKQETLTTDETGLWRSDDAIIGHDYLLVFYHADYALENRNQRYTIGETDIVAETVIASAKESVPETAADAFTYTVLNGTYCQITGYTGTDTAVSIPIEIDGYIVQSIGEKVFENNKTLTTIVFPDTVESIGSYLFSGCTALSDVRLNEGLASISGYAFRNCTSLTEITLPGSVTGIGANAFENCSALETVNLPEGLVSVKNYVFKGCTALETVTLPDSVQQLGYQVFGNCTALSSINYPANLTTMLYASFSYSNHYGSLFSGCTNLKTLEIPEGVTAIPDHALRDCIYLEEITLPASLESIGEYAFSGNTGLKTVEMKDKVTTLGSYAFQNCTGLESVTFSESLSSMGEYAFSSCTALAEAALPGSLKTIPTYAFQKCTGLKKLTVGDGTTEISQSAFETCTGLVDISLPESLVTIQHYAFRGCSALETLTLPDSLQKLGYQTFANCTSLSSANYPAGLTTMLSIYFSYSNHYGSTFSGCTNLKTLEIPEGVTAIPDHALRDCTDLEEVTLPESLETIGEYAFYGSAGLKMLQMQNNLTSAGSEAFRNCTGLKSVIFSETLSTMGEYAFAGCTGLTEVSLPGSLATVPDYAFQNCTGLQKLTVGEGTTEIGQYTFENGTSLTSLALPESLVTIQHYAFRGCTALKKLTIPDSVQKLGYQAFANCTRLASANYPASLTTMLGTYFNYSNHYGSIFSGCTDLLTLKVPEGVTTIPAHALRDCTALMEVVLPESLTAIGENAFRGNTALAKIWIDKNVTTIGTDAFTDCTALTIHGVEGSYAQTYAGSNSIPFSTEPLVYPSRVISGAVTDGEGNGVAGVTVTLYDLTWDRKQEILTTDETGAWSSDGAIIGHEYLLVFYHADYALENRNQRYTIGETDIAAQTVIASAKGSVPETDTADFTYTILNGTYCQITGYTGSDTAVSFPIEIDGYIVQSIAGSLFKNNTALTAVSFPDTVETIGTYLFSGCTALTDVRLNEGLTTIGDYAFQNCSALTEITLPGSVKTIGTNAFENCTALTAVELQEGLITVNHYAFRGCTALEAIRLPDSIQKLGYQAFANCTKLSSANYPAGLTTMLTHYFSYSDHYGSIFSGCTKLKTLEIPEGVTAIPARALQDCTYLETVILPESLESIGDYAFSGCKGLKTVEMKNNVTTVGSYAFQNCTGLENVTFSESLGTMGEYTFSGCTALVEVNLPGSLKTVPTYAFQNCSGLQKLTVGEGTTEISQSAFEKCTGLTSLSLPESLTTIQHYAFRGCTALETLTLPDSIQNLGYQVFANCTSLSSANYPAGLTTMLSHYFSYSDHYSSIFSGCTKLKTLEIPEGVTALPAHALRDCTSLEEVILPGSLESIGDYAFYGCKGLKTVEMKNKVTTVGAYAFQNCTGLKTVTCSDTLATMGEYAFSGCTALTEISLPGSLATIPNYAFQKCTGLRKLTVGEGTEEISQSAFETCTGLFDISLPESLTTIRHYAFRGCTSLEELRLPDSIQNLGYQTFANCTRLSSANYPASLTTMLSHYFSYSNHYGSTFAGCTELKTVQIPEGVTAIPAYAFYGCDTLEEIVFPGTLQTLGSNVFEDCTKLRIVEFNEGLTAIPDYGFRDCTSLAVVDIPSTVTSIGKYAFYNCLGLRIVNLGTGVKTIGDYAFYGCDGLVSLVLNEGLTTIGNNSFGDCANLKSVEVPDSVESIQDTSFKDCGKLTIYCNSGSPAHMVGEAAGLDVFLLDEHEHSFQSTVETEPDCTRDGSQIMICSICNYYYIEILEALGHTEGDWTTLTKPSCTVDGIRVQSCSVCAGEIARDYIPRYGHMESDWVVAEGNCVDGGHKVKTCTICNAELERQEIPAAGHQWSQWLVESMPSVLCEGITSRTCSVCEEREEIIQDKLHVDISADSSYGLVHLTIVNANTLEPVSGAGVFISTESDGEATLATDAEGKLSQILPVGSVNLSVYADGYQTRSITITVEPGEQELPQLGISDGYLVEGKLTAEEMTLEEMEAAGIDIHDPANKHLYKYALVLEFAPEIDWLSIIFYMGSDGLPRILDGFGPIGPSGPSGDGNGSGGGGGGGGGAPGGGTGPWTIIYGPGGYGTGVQGYLPDGQKVSVYPVNERFFLIIYGEVHWVKEMYHVELLTINHSMTDTVENARATLFLPDGLSLAKMVGEQQTLTQQIGTIGCGESKSVHWYVRGDREGTYSIWATLEGHMLPFGDAFAYSYEVEDPIKVYAGSAMHLTYYVPDSAFTGEEYTVRIELENVSDKTLYNVTHAITDIDQFRVTEYSNGMVEIEEYPVVGGTGAIFIPEFRPGDVIVIETTTIIMFESKLIDYQKDQIREMLGAVKGFMEGFEAFETGIGLIGSVTDWIGLAAEAVQDYVDDIVITSSEKEILANSIARQLESLMESLSGEPTAQKMQKIQELKSAGVWDEIQTIANNPDILKDYSGRQLTKLATKLSTANAMQDSEFDIFDAIDKMIELIPVRFRLIDSWVATLEGSTTVIPSTIVVQPVGAHYFGVENISRYIASLMKLYMADLLADAVPIDILGDKFKEDVGYYDALDYVRTVENEASLYKISATAVGSFKAWIERADVAAFSGQTVAGDPAFALAFTSNTGDPEKNGTLDENGVLHFSGPGTLSVTPESLVPGVLCVEMEDGTVKRYTLDVVQAHDCGSEEWKLLYGPSEDMNGMKAKFCDVCGELLDMAAVTGCGAHEFGEYVTVLEPTVEAAGKDVRTCVHCGAEEICYTDALSAGSYVEITADKEFLTSGETTTLTAKILPGSLVEAEILWTLAEADREFATLKGTGNTVTLTAAALTEKREITVTAATADDLADAGSITITIYPRTEAVQIRSGAENVTGKTLPFDLNGETRTLTLTAEAAPADARQTFLWTSSNEKVASVEDGVITFTGTDGKVKITAAAEDGSKKSASITIQTVRVPHNVEKVDEVEGDADIAILGGKSRNLVVMDKDTGKALTAKQITWEIPKEYAAFASINAKGKLTTKKVVALTRIEVLGTIVNSSDDPVRYIIDIYPAVTHVEILDETGAPVNGQTLKLEFSKQIDLDALLHPADAMAGVTWKSSSAKIASVDENGVVLPNENGKSGTVTITATAKDGSKKKATVKIQVGPVVNSVTIAEPVSYILRSGKTLTLKATTDPVKPGVAGVTWEITDGGEYATISASGKLKANTVFEARKVTVVAVSKDAAKVRSEPITITILPNAEETLALKQGSLDVTGQTLALDSLTQGETVTLSAWLTSVADGASADTGAKNVAWTTSDASVASLSAAEGESVTVTLHKAGKATVTATAVVNGKTVTAKVTVKGAALVNSLTITAKEAANVTKTGIEVASGKAVTLVAKANDEAASKKVTWSITKGGAYAAINASGKLTAAKELTSAQPVTVRATAADGSGKTAEVTVTVRPIAQGVQVYTIENGVQTFAVRSSDSIWVRNSTTAQWDLTTQGSTVLLDADVYPFYGADDTRNAMQAVTWKSSAPKVADFVRKDNGDLDLAEGRIKLEVKNPGKTTVTVTAADGSKKKVSFTLNVVKNVNDLELEPQVLASGKSLNLAKLVKLAPTGTTTKKLSWAITGGDGAAYATLSASGALKAKTVTGHKQVIVTATAQDSGGYSEDFTIDLYPATKKVTLFRETEEVTGKTLNVSTGDVFRLTAQPQPGTAAKAFAFSSSKPNLVFVDAEGTVTVLGESGTAVITCTATDGTKKKATVTLRIG